jgi:hypothetical protein
LEKINEIKVQLVGLFSFICSYKGETWSLTFRKKHIPRVFKIMELSKTFGPKPACGKHGKRWKFIHGSDWKNLREGGYSEDLSIDGRTILK